MEAKEVVEGTEGMEVMEGGSGDERLSFAASLGCSGTGSNASTGGLSSVGRMGSSRWEEGSSGETAKEVVGGKMTINVVGALPALERAKRDVGW